MQYRFTTLVSKQKEGNGLHFMKTRFILFFTGIFLMGFGVALITKVDLGTSPISTVPYVVSYIIPGSFGFWTIMLGILFIVLQAIILRTVKEHSLYLQLLINPLLGISIDVGMWLLNAFMPDLFIIRILFLILGCFILAMGIYLQIKGQLAMNPGEGMVQVLAEKLNKPFGTMKIWFDCSLVVAAILLGLLFLKTPVGIGIGTLISALIVGYFVKLINKWNLLERITSLKYFIRKKHIQ